MPRPVPACVEAFASNHAGPNSGSGRERLDCADGNSATCSGWLVAWAVRYCPIVKTALRLLGLACLAVAAAWTLLGLRASRWNLRGAWRSVQVMFDRPRKDLPPGAFDMTKPLYLVTIGVSLLSLAS